MPANLTPAYKAAEAAYRRARDPDQQLDCLREMMRTIPKHKGTEHLRADIKTRMRELTEALAGPRKGGVRGGPPTVIKPEGAGQVALIGPPNSGKSALFARLTSAHSDSGPYPFGTQFPHPGMIPVEDIAIQLIDLPSISNEHPIPWLGNAIQPADAGILVVDLSQPGCVEQVLELHEQLRERKIELSPVWPEDVHGLHGGHDLFTHRLPVVMAANKVDLIPNIKEELATFTELTGLSYPTIRVSAETGEGVDRVGPWLFDALGIVRVYTKIPGQPADLGRPFTLRRGQTVIDVAALVHRDIAASFKYARLWGGGDFDGQQVGRDHLVLDGDILELHT